MHLGEELVVLGILLLLAYVLGRAGKLIGLPAIPIYMIVGLFASPHTGWFPLSFDGENLEFIAIFGLILLLFNLGLEFDQDEFFGNAGKLLLSGGSYIAVNMAFGFLFGYLLGWGGREALIIAGITATSSSAIVTKLLIELKRLPNRETPMILGVTVVEDIFIAVYLAIVGVVLSGETEVWPVVLKLVISFLFLVVMFSLARWGGKAVSRLIRTKDDELFTILFFGLAVLFAGIGEMLGVTDAIGAFLIGLVLGATRFRHRIETMSLPMRDLFGAFFFLNFGLALDVTTFGSVLGPVVAAVGMTVVLNIIAGQFVAWLNKLGPQAGINAFVILQNRGEFALILATLATAAGLDERIVPFAGLYVLIMSVMGPIVAANSERIGARILRPRRPIRRRTTEGGQRDASPERSSALTDSVAVPDAARDRARADAIALVEATSRVPAGRAGGRLPERDDDGGTRHDTGETVRAEVPPGPGTAAAARAGDRSEDWSGGWPDDRRAVSSSDADADADADADTGARRDAGGDAQADGDGDALTTAEARLSRQASEQSDAALGSRPARVRDPEY